MRIFWTLMILITTLSLFGQKNDIRSVTAGSSSGQTITIDGKFTEPVWKTVMWESNFTQFQPYEDRVPSQQTEFAVLYDNKYVYIGIKNYDTSADSIVQRLTRRDDVDGDAVGVQFDTYNDKRTAFSFIVAASGVKSDFVVSNDGMNEDETWDPIWWAKTTVDSSGWSAEIAIPFSQLRFEGNMQQGWGIQVGRDLFRKQELSLWQPSQRKLSGWVSQFGRLNGFGDIQPKKNFDVIPYFVARTEYFEKEIDNPFKNKGRRNYFRTGVDAKIGLTNNLTLDLTVNPDFGQVEADPSVVNLSTYETFFREQRPFFIEGKNILNFNLMFGDMSSEGLFYSRRIGSRPHYSPKTGAMEYMQMPDFTQIIGAAKVTGKTRNGWSLGLLESVTSEEFAEIQGFNVKKNIEVEPLTNFLVGRAQKDFNNGNTYLGGMVTSVNRRLDFEELQFLHKDAYSGGMDFVHKWKDKKWEFDASVYFSHVTGTTKAITRTQQSYIHLFQRPDAKHLKLDTTLTWLGGQGGKLMIGKFSGNLKFMNAVAWKSPGLELNDLGYMRQADNILQVFWMGYNVYEPFFIFRDLNVNLSQYTEWNFAGVLTAPGVNFNLHANTRKYWELSFGTQINGQQIRVSQLRGGPALKMPGNYSFEAGIESNDKKKLTFELSAEIDRTFENGSGSEKQIDFEIGYRPLKSLKISINPEFDYEKNALQYVTTKTFGNNKRYLFGSIERKTLGASVRISLNLTPELSLQYWGQPFIASGKYSKFKVITNPMADNYSQRFREFSSQEISYQPQTEVYLVTETGLTAYTFGKPDFNVKEFLSNMVLRWEYRPGSTLFLVWSQNFSSEINDGTFRFGNDIKELFTLQPHHVFLLKFSYRIGK